MGTVRDMKRVLVATPPVHVAVRLSGAGGGDVAISWGGRKPPGATLQGLSMQDRHVSNPGGHLQYETKRVGMPSVSLSSLAP